MHLLSYRVKITRQPLTKAEYKRKIVEFLSAIGVRTTKPKRSEDVEVNVTLNNFLEVRIATASHASPSTSGDIGRHIRRLATA